MKKILPFIAPFILIIAFLVDGQLSTLFVNWSPWSLSIASYVLLMVGIFLSISLPLWYGLLLFTLMGFIYDSYYLSVIGMATTLFPLMMYLVYYFYQYVSIRNWTNILLLVVIIFLFDFISFGLARLFQLTNLSMFIYVFYDLVPTLAVNTLLFIGLQPFLKKCFGITNKT